MSGKQFLYALLSATVAVLSLAAAAVSAPPPSISTGPSTAMKMRQHILTALTGRATGFAYAIVKDGRLVIGEGVGKARTGPDGDQNMGSSSRLNVMSVTRRRQRSRSSSSSTTDLSVDSRINKWLPAEWTKGLGVWGSNGLTFRHLLTHTSGARAGPHQAEGDEPRDRRLLGERLDGLEFVVSNGAAPGSARTAT